MECDRAFSVPMQEKTTDIYDSLARIYDKLFFVLKPGHRRVGKYLKEQNIKQILEVGVGTGLTFEYYPAGVDVTAVDMSSGMLKFAHERRQVRSDITIDLSQMDALDLKFPDNHFECTYAPSLLTVVPHPKQLIREMIRVTKPGGTIIIVSHFEGDYWQDRAFSKFAAPFTKRLFGFRMDLKFRLFEQCPEVEFLAREKVNPVGPYCLSHLVILRKQK